MYYKIINDRMVFSECKTIITAEGLPVSNPTAEQIAAAGWQVYVPPVVPPVPQTEPDYDEIVEAVKRMFSTEVTTLSDEDALAVAALYPTFVSKIGESVTTGERLWYDGDLWKVLQPHTVLENWTPDTSPSLYVRVSIEEWPEWVRPISAETAYNEGDRVTFEGAHYISLINGNTWSPAEYSAGWQLVG